MTTTRPPTSVELTLLQKAHENIVTQVERMDKLAQQLITIELAVPGVYAAVLKMVTGQDTAAIGLFLIIAFASWLLALGWTLFALVPHQTKTIRNSPDDVERVFLETAERKYRRIMTGIGFFVTGILATLLDIFL